MGARPSQGSSRCSGGGWWGDGELGSGTGDGQGCHRRSPVLVERRQRLHVHIRSSARWVARCCLPRKPSEGVKTHGRGFFVAKKKIHAEKADSERGECDDLPHSSVIFLFPAARALARGVARRRRKGDGCEEERGAHGTQHRLDGGGQLLHLVRARARVS